MCFLALYLETRAWDVPATWSGAIYSGAKAFYTSHHFSAGDGSRYKRSPYKILDFDLVGT